MAWIITRSIDFYDSDILLPSTLRDGHNYKREWNSLNKVRLCCYATLVHMYEYIQMYSWNKKIFQRREKKREWERKTEKEKPSSTPGC